MQRFVETLRLFMKEPLWFRILILITLLLSIVFSGSYFADQPVYQGLSKLAAAVFFCSLGIKLRRNRPVAIVFIGLAIACIYLSWQSVG